MKEKLDLGRIVNWTKIDKPNRIACWELSEVLGIFIRDYLYKFIEENTHVYPREYESIEEWHAKVKEVADNFAFGIKDIDDFYEPSLADSVETLIEKDMKLNEIAIQQQECILKGFDGLKEIFWNLRD